MATTPPMLHDRYIQEETIKQLNMDKMLSIVDMFGQQNNLVAYV